MPVKLQLMSCRGSCTATRYPIKYQPDIHGCDVLICGEDGPCGQQDLHNHVKPVRFLRHEKCAREAHSITGVNVGTHRP
jgi:hypothetical protein